MAESGFVITEHKESVKNVLRQEDSLECRVTVIVHDTIFSSQP